MRVMGCFLILWGMIIATDLLGWYGLYGSQEWSFGGSWYLGIWMWLWIESYVYTAKLQSLRLVSLNQLQRRGLELVKVVSFFCSTTQTYNIYIIGNTQGLAMVIGKNEKSWCVSWLVRLYGRTVIEFVPVIFVFWSHGLGIEWKIEVCINTMCSIIGKDMEFLAFVLWSCFAAHNNLIALLPMWLSGQAYVQVRQWINNGVLRCWLWGSWESVVLDVLLIGTEVRIFKTDSNKRRIWMDDHKGPLHAHMLMARWSNFFYFK